MRVVIDQNKKIFSLFILVIISTFILPIQCTKSCDRGDGTDSGDSVKVIRRMERSFDARHYLTTLDLLSKKSNYLSKIDYYWYLADIYWELARMYELGHVAAVQLQQMNYLYSVKMTTSDLQSSALYFLAYANMLLGNQDECIKIAKLLERQISKQHSLYSRIYLMAHQNEENSVLQDDSNYLFYMRLKNRIPPRSIVENSIKKMQCLNKDDDIMRQIDLLYWAKQLGYYDDLNRILGNDFKSYDVYSQHITLQGDNKTTPSERLYKDFTLLDIRAKLYYYIYSDVIDSLVYLSKNQEFDYYLYERKGWACYHLNQYDEAIKYFKKWIEYLPQVFNGKELIYNQKKYSSLINLCNDLDNKNTRQNYNFSQIMLTNPIELNSALQYQAYLASHKITMQGEKFLKSIMKNRNILLKKLDTFEPVETKITIENILLVLKLSLYYNQAPATKPVVRWLNGFTKEYSIEKMKQMYGNLIDAQEFFALFPVCLSTDVEHINLISQEFLRVNENPFALELSNMLQLCYANLTLKHKKPVNDVTTGN